MMLGVRLRIDRLHVEWSSCSSVVDWPTSAMESETSLPHGGHRGPPPLFLNRLRRLLPRGPSSIVAHGASVWTVP